MKELSFDAMPLSEKAAFVHDKGQFLEAQDFYSFFFLIYSLNKQHIKLLYDFSGTLVSVETIDDSEKDNFITDQLQSALSAFD